MKKTKGKMSGDLVVRVYDGEIIEQRKTDRYTNATSMCKATGKMWGDYWRNQTTQEFIDELASSMGIPIDDLVQSRAGNPEYGGGTWIHPRVAIHLAHWCSARFAVQVSGWIEELLTLGTVSLQPMTQIQMIAAMANQMAEQERQVEANRQLSLTTAARTDQLAAKVEEIEQSRKLAKYDLATIERSDARASEKTLRAKVNELVRAYASYHSVEFPEVWKRLYSEMYYRVNFNPQVRANNQTKSTGKKISAIDVIEREGYMGELYAIASEVLVLTKKS